MKTLLPVALVAILLGGCVSARKVDLTALPPIPADLRVCFDETVPAPAPGPMTKGAVIDLIAILKASEAEKTECGRRLISFYESLST